jgi:hypothetical protein
MKHELHRVTDFAILAPFTLRVLFADGLSRVINFEPMLEGELYGPLREPHVFEAVTLDPEVHTLVWPNGADFDPATLHDWPEHEGAFRQAACRWKQGAVVA